MKQKNTIIDKILDLTIFTLTAGLLTYGVNQHLENRAIRARQESRLEQKMEAPSQKIKTVQKTQETNQDTERVAYNYTLDEMDKTAQVLYAEAANQPRDNRKLITRTILNRMDNPQYPQTLDGCLYQKNAFSCLNGEGSKLWKQATGKLPMNGYEKQVMRGCEQNVANTFAGEELGVPFEKNIIAYHDNSITKPKDAYWNNLTEVFRNKKLIFYAPKDVVEKARKKGAL